MMNPRKTSTQLSALLILLSLIPGISQLPAFAQETAVDTTTVSALPSDSVLVQQIRRVFITLEGFEGIRVHAHEGIVRLAGDVADVSKQDQAGELAAAFPDVLYVINDIGTDIEVEARVAPVLERIQGYVNDSFAFLPVLAIAIIVLIVFALLSRFVDTLLPSFHKMGVSPMVGNLILRLTRAFLWIIGVVLALDIMGISALVGAVLGTAGLMGIAIGFAFQDIIENYLAGLLMSVRHPFAANDLVKVGDHEGKVVRLTSRELVLMTLDGNHVRIPNGEVFKSTIYNYSRNPRRRFSFEIGVDVVENLSDVQQLALDTLRSMSAVMDEPAPWSAVQSLGDSNVVVALYAWVDQTKADFTKARSEAIRLVKQALDNAGVQMPEPIYIVKMQQQPETSPSGPSKRETLQEGDVTVQKDIDEQIQEDLQVDNEPNLLSESS